MKSILFKALALFALFGAFTVAMITMGSTDERTWGWIHSPYLVWIESAIFVALILWAMWALLGTKGRAKIAKWFSKTVKGANIMKQIHKTPPRNDRGVTLQHIIVGVTLSVLVFGVGILGSVVWQTWFGNENVVQQAEAEVSDFFAEVSAPTTTTTEPPRFSLDAYERHSNATQILEQNSDIISGVERASLLAKFCVPLTLEAPVQLIDYCLPFLEWVVELPTKTQIHQAAETQTG